MLKTQMMTHLIAEIEGFTSRKLEREAARGPCIHSESARTHTSTTDRAERCFRANSPSTVGLGRFEKTVQNLPRFQGGPDTKLASEQGEAKRKRAQKALTWVRRRIGFDKSPQHADIDVKTKAANSDVESTSAQSDVGTCTQDKLRLLKKRVGRNPTNERRNHRAIASTKASGRASNSNETGTDGAAEPLQITENRNKTNIKPS